MECGLLYGVDPPFQPTPQSIAPPVMCPEFVGRPVCCFEYNNEKMIQQFQELEYTFGGGAGGCDVCAANMKRLWCHFVCSPEQASFANPGDYAWVPSPIDPGTIIEVLQVNFTVTSRMACELYQSCRKCPYVQQVSAMQSAQGFLQFQGANSAIGGEMITFYFQEESTGALDLELVQCDYSKDQVYGMDIRPCSCNK